MELDGYTIEKNEKYIAGEEYFFYKDSAQVGWMRFDCGILRVSTDVSKKFIFHDLYGEECVDEFPTAKERRKAIRFATKLLREHYGEKPSVLSTVAAIFPGATLEQQGEQLRIF